MKMAFLHSFTFLMLSHFILTCSSSPPTIVSEQIKFWSQNVRNQMPQSIINKLSPLSKKDSDFYTSLISKNDEFTVDSNFCSLAQLACVSVLDSAKTVRNTYTTSKTYSGAAVFGDQKSNEDPFSFFRLSALRIGNLIHLPYLDDALPDRTFLPLDIASKISLSTSNIFRMFPESSSGHTKETTKTSLSYCNAEEIKGEIKSCPRSLEEMISFTKSALGGKPLLSLTSSKSTVGTSNAEMIVKNVKKINADKIVACHEVFLPFATYFCHSLTSTNLYQVDLAGTKSDLSAVNTMLAICHMDTSPWPANHVAFKILKSGPGLGEACHWFTQLDLAWINAN